MYLVKCKCGCFFTVKNEAFFLKNKNPYEAATHLSCSNCNKSVSFTQTKELREINTLFIEAGMEVQVIPDNATIKVEYNL